MTNYPVRISSIILLLDNKALEFSISGVVRAEEKPS